MTRKKYILFFWTLFIGIAGSIAATPDSLVYKVKGDGNGLSISMNGSRFAVKQSDENLRFWLYNGGDNYRFALKDLDDKKWKNITSDFEETEIDSSFKGVCWMRLHYRMMKDAIGSVFMLKMSEYGASEIFNDNKLLASYGIVSRDPNEEKAVDPTDDYIPLVVNDTLEHVIAVRYSNANYKKYDKSFSVKRIGFVLRFLYVSSMVEYLQLNSYQSYFFIALSLFLFALALVHLMIFLFERSRKFNLYHSLFVGALSLLFITPVIHRILETPIDSFRLSYYSDFLIPSFFISGLALLYNLFQKRLNRFFYLCLIVYIAALVCRYVFNSDIAGVFYITLFFMMYIGSIIISIKAIRQNFRGAKIVGTGVLGTTVLIISSILAIIVLQDKGLVISILLAILGILSLPLSMSVYLAFDFAKANKTLSKQIVQIEELSAQALKDEQEKKQILENQNQMLEEQVRVRTAEIVEQKEIIEEKNKDITDSINYAKRIQEATLASKEIKYKLFPDAFVLFKPKDIVSGDFYWFAGKNGKRLISACDCTGHGVPGALMSMIGNNLLNKIVNEKAVTSPGSILIELDEEVRLTLKKDENKDSKDGMDIALLTFSNERDLEYAGANRPLWIVRDGKLEEIKPTKLSIGGDRYGQQIDFINHSIQLQKGDTVYISSDGFADQFNNDDKKLMTRRFKEILLSIQNLPMPEQEKYLDDFIEKWKGGLEQTDDILVIGVRV